MEYLRKFDKHSDYERDRQILDLPNVSLCVQENEVHYNPIVPSALYLTFIALEDGTFSFKKNGTSDDIQYSLDNGTTWTSLASETNTPTVTASSKILWKAELTPTNSGGIGTFSSTSRFNVEGNVMSLLFGDNFKGQTDLTDKNYAFRYLFNNCANLVSAEKLSLLATTLAYACYLGMFNGCSSLTTAPELPATTLANYCYSYMFYGCTSLTTAPSILPATTLTSDCYQYMFKGCTSLTIAPELPATTLAYGCYFEMFRDCTSLTTAPSILPATTLVSKCYSSMFKGCTSLTIAPELPATTLVIYCYEYMFEECTNLNYIKCLATKHPSSETSYWVNHVASTGTFVKAADATWTTGVSGIPSGWTVIDA